MISMTKNERTCPKCGAEMDLKAGVVYVCPVCGFVRRRGENK